MFANTSVSDSRVTAADALRSFYARAESDLARIRSGILIFLQEPSSTGDLDSAIRELNTLHSNAQAAGMFQIAERLRECEQHVASIRDHQTASLEYDTRRALDLIAEAEALLLTTRIEDDDRFSISGFLDESFRGLAEGFRDDTPGEEFEPEAKFEIDEETIEIFRGEAGELLESISANLNTLTKQPGDLDALWNIRRCAHTFKGAAGIVGLHEASTLAHRVEDLLDQLAKDQFVADAAMLELLAASTEHLSLFAFGCGAPERLTELSIVYSGFDRVLKDSAAGSAAASKELRSEASEINPVDIRHNAVQTSKPAPAPIARVALDRLDELLNLTRDLAKNRSALAKELSLLSADNIHRVLETIGPIFEAQRELTDEIEDRLLRIRMVRFGMLATRLKRAVHVTCQEENKKAELVIDNEDFEIDTQILDSLVEPLLHLLRNAVVHGIEPPERRRLIGKPEKAQIRIEVGSSDDQILLSVHDDGRGISTSKLRDKAVASGLVDQASADALTEEEAFDLMFLRGITTANNLSMNAGRGVGMSIVKESIGSIGGTISIAAEPQTGTTFTIQIPLVTTAAAFDPVDIADELCIAKAESAHNSATVLIVDDSSTIRQLITRMLEKAGCKCIPAADGQNALEILADTKIRPDLILTDLEMPHVDGYEFLVFLKNNAYLRDIPVVMITSRTGEEHKQKAIALGADDYIVKPFDKRDIERILTTFCNRG